MRVLLVNDHPPGPAGGAEVHVGQLAAALEHDGHDVSMFHAERLHDGWRRVLDLWDPAARRAFRHHVGQFGPDIIHFHNITNELSTSVVGSPVPSVLTIHDPRILGVRFGPDQYVPAWSPGAIVRGAKDRIARHRLRRNVRATIVPNARLAEQARSAGFPAVSVVENFTPVTPCGPPGHDVVYVGKLESHKGPQVLVDAWARIADRHEGVTLRVVGDGSQRDRLQREIDVAGLADRVDMVGALEPEDVVQWLRTAAVVAVPSLGLENFPLVVLEAMAAGRPVVVSDWDGVADVVDDTVGAVVPAGDAGALADAIDHLLSDRAQLGRLGTSASARAAARWSPAAQTQSVVAVYETARR